MTARCALVLGILLSVLAFGDEPVPSTRVRGAATQGWVSPSPNENALEASASHDFSKEWTGEAGLTRQQRFWLTDTFLGAAAQCRFKPGWAAGLEGGHLPHPGGEHVLPTWTLGSSLWFPLPRFWSGEAHYVHRAYANARADLFSIDAPFEGLRPLILVPRVGLAQTHDATISQDGTTASGGLRAIVELPHRQRVWITGGFGGESAAVGNPVELRALRVWTYGAGYDAQVLPRLKLGVEGQREKYPELPRDTWRLQGLVEVLVW